MIVLVEVGAEVFVGKYRTNEISLLVEFVSCKWNEIAWTVMQNGLI